MSTDHTNDPDTDSGEDSSDGQGHRSVGGDDERENREQIAKTGEPHRDALGNADGAS